VLTNPDGIAGSVSAGFGRLLPWRRGEGSSLADAATDLPASGVTRGFTPGDLTELDRRLGVPAALRFELPDVATGRLVDASLAEVS